MESGVVSFFIHCSAQFLTQFYPLQHEGRFVKSLAISEMKGVFGTSDHWIWPLMASAKLGLANTLVHGCDLRAFVYSGGC